jgi:calcineurin-like phosphoesterase family protein
MIWLLFIYSDKYFENIEIVFSNRYSNGNYHKTFRLNEYSSCDEFERSIVILMNLNVAMCDVVYIVCDIRLEVYEYLNDKMKMLFSRTNGIIDLQSFMILKQIKDTTSEKIEFFL